MDWLGVLPFAAMLLGIALLPLLVPHLWEHPAAPYALVIACSLPVVVFAPGLEHRSEILHSLAEYIAFMALISALFVTAGGIHISGNPRGTPAVNTAVLAIGAVAASLIGTTGASMLLIRPFLEANRERTIKTHIAVFFILIVSNSGGLLTPLGDPPLYLGYLNGVPFTFTFGLWPAWLLAQVVLLSMFWIWDRRAYGQEPASAIRLDIAHQTPFRIRGQVNIAIALGIIACSAAGLPSPWREIGYLVLIALSLQLTDRSVREANTFHYGPLKEVAILFFGIFVTMAPALRFLERIAPSLPVDSASGLFVMSGLLSSLLDNAPTYLLFASLASAKAGFGSHLGELAAHAPHLLAAISIGSVFMGANTYIGNGPNLLVKAVAEGAGDASIKMPNFLAYAAMATGLLIPVYIGVLLFVL